MNKLNEIMIGSGGGVGFLFGAISTQELIGAFILGIVGALGGLLVNLVLKPWIKARLK